MDGDEKKPPAKQGEPPKEHQFKPGQSGNPRGRRPAGLSVLEYINNFAEHGYREKKLRAIARSKSNPWTKRAAAERCLRMLEAGDVADFAGLLRGENNLEDLRGMGINTEVVKKFKQKTRKVPVGDGETEEVIEREIELHDRAGTDFDRIMDRTLGKPKQEITSHVNGSLNVADGATEASQLAAAIAAGFNTAAEPAEGTKATD